MEVVGGGRRDVGVVEEGGFRGRSSWEGGGWVEGGCSIMEEGRLIVLDGRERVLRL